MEQPQTTQNHPGPGTADEPTGRHAAGRSVLDLLPADPIERIRAGINSRNTLDALADLVAVIAQYERGVADGTVEVLPSSVLLAKARVIKAASLICAVVEHADEPSAAA